MRKSSDNETAGTAGRRLQTQGTDRGSPLGSERTSAPNGTPDGRADALPEARRPPRTPVRRACRVAVVDPDESVHLSVREALGNRANRCEVQGYRTPAELFARILAETPEVVLMEIGLPGTSGIDLARRLKSLWPRLPVIMLTTRSDTGAIFRALMAGARGYLIKPVSVPELRRALACVLAGWPGLSPLAAKALVEGLQRAGAEARDQGFTPREQIVTSGLFQGLENKEISDTMHVAPNTVHAYLNHIFDKLDVHSRAAARRRLLDLNPAGH